MKRPRTSLAGSSIVTVIVLTSLMLLLLLCIGGVSRMNFLFASYDERSLKAELYAESAVNLAYAAVLDGEVGLSRDIAYPAVTPGQQAAEQGGLAFDDDFAGGPWAWRSVNNLVNSSAVVGSLGVVVPARSIHLVGVGRSGEVQVVSDAIYRMKTLPFSVASAGAVRGQDMEVFAVESLDQLADGTVEDQDKKPAHVVSNYRGARYSVELGPNTTVSGDVRAAGDADVSRASVAGQVLKGQSPQNLPQVNPRDYDPKANSEPAFDFIPGTTTEISKGKARYAGNLTVSNLKLEDGLLYVEGSLAVTGKVTGKGALVATEDIIITGSLNTAADLTAVVAGGDVVIQGQGREATRLRGLVYAGGSFKAKDATVVGAVVSAAVDGLNEFERVNLIETPELRDMEIWVDVKLDEVMESYRGGRDGSTPIGLLYQGQFTAFRPENESALRLLAQELVASGSDDWKVVAQVSPGQYEEEPEGEAVRLARNARDNWNGYLAVVKAGSEERREIFSLDLNSFLSVESGLELLKFRTNARGSSDGGADEG